MEDNLELPVYPLQKCSLTKLFHVLIRKTWMAQLSCMAPKDVPGLSDYKEKMKHYKFLQ